MVQIFESLCHTKNSSTLGFLIIFVSHKELFSMYSKSGMSMLILSSHKNPRKHTIFFWRTKLRAYISFNNLHFPSSCNLNKFAVIAKPFLASLRRTLYTMPKLLEMIRYPLINSSMVLKVS